MPPRRSAKPPENEVKTPRRPPATTLEARENQLISAAVSLAEQQILNGSASSQVITHYLKLGSTREKLEQERLRQENILLEAKAADLETRTRSEEMYTRALNAMRSYTGQEPPPEEGDDEDY